MRPSPRILCSTAPLLLVAALAATGCRFSFSADDRCFEGEPCAEDTLAPESDPDEDGIPTSGDRCPLDWDPAQLDSDADGTGDACDACPFASAATTQPCYPETFEPVQLLGRWTGLVTLTGAGLTVQPITVILSASNYELIVPGQETRFDNHVVGEGGTLRLKDLPLPSGPVDVAMVVDSSRQLAAGTAVVPSSAGEPGAVRPAGLVTLVREVASDGEERPERLLHPDETDRRWWLLGHARFGGEVLTVQGELTTHPAEDGGRLLVQPFDETGGLAYLFTTDNAQVGDPPAIRLDGGTIIEHPDGVSVTLRAPMLGPEGLTLSGALTASRDLMVLHSADAEREVSLLLAEQAPDEPSGAWALAGARVNASLRGLAPSGFAADAPIGLQLHGPEDVLAAVSTLSEAGLHQRTAHARVEATFPLGPGTKIERPRLCVRPTPAGHVGLAALCSSAGILPSEGCPVSAPCWVALGLAIGAPALPPTDFDLDGLATEGLDPATPCQGTGDDPCPCAPLETCPTSPR